jgi:PAS domain S-box-containing protein
MTQPAKNLRYALVLALSIMVIAVAVIELLAWTLLRLPTLTILLAVVAMIAFRWGLREGFISAAVAVLYGAYYFATHHRPPQAPGYADLQLLLLTSAIFVVVLLMGLLRRDVWAAEAELRRQLTMLELIIEQLPAHLWTTDANLQVTSVKGSALAGTDIDTQQYVGRKLINLVSADGTAILAAHHAALTGTSATYQRVFANRHFDVRVEPLRDAEGQIVGCLGLAHDVTERLVAERLSELDRLRREFIASISHDLRTPLTAIRAGIGMVSTSAAERLHPDEQRLVGNAQRNIERLDRHIRDLLALNQLEMGLLQLECTPLDLRAVVNDALSAVQLLVKEKKQTIVLDLPEPLPVEGDAWRLEQVLVNLLGNAQHHTPPGTHIAVRGCVVQNEVRLQVCDTGPGIPAEEHEAIFTRFRRVGVPRGGSGLGLAIAKGIVALHQGRIWIESPHAGGTTVHIALPRHDAAPVAGAPRVALEQNAP